MRLQQSSGYWSRQAARRAGTTTVYLLDQHCREHDQTNYLLRYHERQHNGTTFTKIQWSMFLVSVAVASTLLVLFVVERLLP